MIKLPTQDSFTVQKQAHKLKRAMLSIHKLTNIPVVSRVMNHIDTITYKASVNTHFFCSEMSFKFGCVLYTEPCISREMKFAYQQRYQRSKTGNARWNKVTIK